MLRQSESIFDENKVQEDDGHCSRPEKCFIHQIMIIIYLKDVDFFTGNTLFSDA